jgi:hypothetical protein
MALDSCKILYNEHYITVAEFINVCPYAGDIFTIKIKFTFVRFKLRDCKKRFIDISHRIFLHDCFTRDFLSILFKK